MSDGSTASLTLLRPPVPSSLPSEFPELERPLPRWLAFRPILALSAAVAGLSLLLFRTPTFDVWAWLLWGREAAHLDMNTTWGPAFKPLPVAVTTVLAPLGDAAPVAWLFLARLGGLLAVGAAARLAYRYGGALAAVVAAVGLLMTRQYVGYLLPHGMSEPMMVAFLLWGLDRAVPDRAAPDGARHGHRETAFWLGICAGFLRPEIWPFLAGYALVLARARPGWLFRGRLVGGLVALPLGWYLPDYLASGEPFRAGEGVPVPGGPLTQASPLLAVFQQTSSDVQSFVLIGALLGVGWAIRWRSRRLLGYVVLGLGWILIVALMAQAGRSTGVSRYVLPTYSLLAVLAGIGWAATASALLRWWRSRSPVGLLGAMLLAAGGVSAATAAGGWSHEFADEARELRYQAGLQRALPHAIDAAGGARVVAGCGQTWTSQYQVPFVAWTLNERIDQVWSLQEPGLSEPAYVGPLLQTQDRQDAPLAPVPFDFLRYRTGGSAGADGATWTILLPSDCS